MDPVDELRKLEDAIEQRLKLNSDFVALQAVKRAIRDIVNAGMVADMPSSPSTASNVSFSNVRARLRQAQTPSGGSPSQADAAFAILKEKGEVLSISELVPLARARGAIVGGNNPELNLSSSLSRDGRFISLRIAGRPMWGLKDVTYADVDRHSEDDSQGSDLEDHNEFPADTN
ncbi:winged helix-turn-helix domain-containing protein [Methylobacterium gregans]|uniref:winged helix-turn-helix domain-containing protein n=1 Tax=Methylobacterium gregans TaxID=374424 RepID=UPI001EE1C35A|nr:winged helix-turn-helix domain-containing protein [Methylobacterium gregans]MDQ0523947.1 hypothetical protein [Methylobacterium gregans]GLS56086.1 hypothetical protein GCM10007886_42710 [Methylobacterium gregans]